MAIAKGVVSSVIALLAMSALGDAPTRTTYYVTSAGSDSNTGTSPGAAWKTLAKVNSSLPAGATALFNGGETFVGPLTPPAGTSAKPTICGSYGSGKATIAATADHGAYMHNTPYVHLVGLKFTGTTADAITGVYASNDQAGNTTLSGIVLIGLEVSGFGDGIDIGGDNGESGWTNSSIVGCVAHNNAVWGIVSYASGSTPANTNITIANCLAYSNGGSGIVMAQVTNGSVHNCIAHDNGATATNGPIGIWTYGSTNVTIEWCESYANTAASGPDGGGFDIDGNCTNCTMQYNYSHGNRGAGFLVYSFANAPNAGSVVRFNLSIDDGINNGASIYVGADISTTTTGFKIYQNTVVQRLATKGAFGLVPSSGTTTGDVANNIFYATAYWMIVGADVAINFKGNCYAGGGKIGWNGTDYTTVALWQAVKTTQEKVSGVNVSLSADPLFANLATGTRPVDFQPVSASPVKSAGINLGVVLSINPGAQDLLGAALHVVPPDIGAMQAAA
jgi:hypothetical protein